MSAVIVFFVAAFGIFLTRQSGRIASIWLANAAQLAILLRSPKSSHYRLLGVGFLANLAAGLCIGDRLVVAVFLSACNTMEVALSRRILLLINAFEPSRLLRLRELARFVLVCGIVTPALSASAASGGMALLGAAPIRDVWLSWYAADALGLLLAVPLVSATKLSDLRKLMAWPQLAETLALLSLVVLASGIAFYFNRIKLVWLVFPASLLATIRLGFPGATISSMVTAIIGISVVLSGKSLGAFDTHWNLRTDIAFLQLILGGEVLTLLPVGSLLQALWDAERRNQEVTASLLTANRLNQKMFEVSPAGILIFDADGTFLRANESVARMVGLTVDEMLGLNYRTLPSWEKSGLRAAADRALEIGTVVRGETQAVSAGGKDIYVEYAFKSFEENQHRRLLMIIVDISERARVQAAQAQTQRNLQTILDNLDALVVFWDSDLRCRYANHKAEEWLGWSLPTLPNRHARDVMGPAWFADAESRFAATLRNEPQRYQRTLQTNRGSMEMLVSMIPECESGRVTGIFVLAVDVTQLKEAERGAQAASLAKTEFLANMSHEIRTPLNAVIGYSTLLLDTPLSTEQQEHVSAIRTAGDALLSQINAILDLSKIEAGKLELELIPCELRPAIEDAIDILAESARKKGLLLTYQIQADCPAQWVCDPGRLRQVLINLIGNAVKFTDSGDVIVRVSPTSTATQPLLQFEIEDTGPGIRPADVPKLFQPFSQADASMSRRHGGSGLGMFVCRRIVESLGGTIGVRPGRNTGTVVFFTVPIVEPTQVLSLSDNLPVTSLGRRILIIGGHLPTRVQLTQMFATMGLESVPIPDVDSVSTILAQQTKAQAKDPSPLLAVLTDPLLDDKARELVQALRQTPGLSQLPVLRIVSQIESPSTQPPNFGSVELLRRPIRFSRLLHTVRELIGTSAVGGNRRRAKRASSTEISIAKHPPRLLLAEDNPANQRLAMLMLQKLGCRVDTASTGTEALTMVKRFRYDLIMMDCQMPEMDGLQATAEIRKLSPPESLIPIVALTANAFRSDQERCLAIGMNDFLSKPITIEQLVPTLRRWLPAHFPAPDRTPSSPSVPPNEMLSPAGELLAEVERVKARMTELRDILDETTLKQSRELAYKDWEDQLAGAEKALSDGKLAQIGKHMHRLAGSALEMGAKRLAERCRAVELACKKEDRATVAKLYSELVTYYRCVLMALAAAGLPMNE